MLIHLRFGQSPTFSGPALIDGHGVPRFWPIAWQALLPGDGAPATVAKALGHIEAFYGYADTHIGTGALDAAIARCDVICLLNALEGYFYALRNHPPLTAASEERWQTCVRYVVDTTQRVARGVGDPKRIQTLESQLREFRTSTGQLYIGRRRNPEKVRSLPADIVEALYQILDPSSSRNPFQTLKSRWLAFTIFILLLHQGLRRGELLNLPTDAVKGGVDRSTHKARHWISVKFNEYEDDPRYSAPSIKTAQSVRQIPVSEATAAVVDAYVLNHRGNPNHAFLMNSQKRLPLSTEQVTKIFRRISQALPLDLRAALQDHTGKDTISPHDLRHTCAVVRLNQLLASGVEMNDALEQLRAFFGWARDSQMPLRYARAVFEHRLASVWNSRFDDRVEILRSIPARVK